MANSSNTKAQRTSSQNNVSVQRCGGCGFRIRGENHIEGQHHQLATNNKKKVAPVGRK